MIRDFVKLWLLGLLVTVFEFPLWAMECSNSPVEITENLETQLWPAVGRGDFFEVRELINQGVLVNCRDVSGETPLHIAAKKGFLITAQDLLNGGAEVNAQDNAGFTPLMYALQAKTCEDYNLTKLLLRYAANVNYKMESTGKTPLHYAAESGNQQLEELILRIGADVNVQDNHGTKPLVSSGPGGVVNYLLYNVAVDPVVKDRVPPQMMPFITGDVASIKEKIEREPCYIGHQEFHPYLKFAAARGHRAIFELLVEKGISLRDRKGVAVEHGGYTLADLAMRNGFLELGEYIVKHDGGGFAKRGPLHNAVLRNDTKLLEQMIKNIGDKKEILDTQDCDGNTPLHIAAKMLGTPNFELLMRAGGNFYTKNKKDKIPLTLVFKNPSPGNLLYLVTALFKKPIQEILAEYGGPEELIWQIAGYLAGAHLHNVTAKMLDNAPIHRSQEVLKNLALLNVLPS
jgi:ankyrin repeat protein